MRLGVVVRGRVGRTSVFVKILCPAPVRRHGKLDGLGRFVLTSTDSRNVPHV